MDMSVEKPPISLCLAARTAKRSFDIFASATGLLFLGWMIAIGWVVATLDTRKNGFYFQRRIGFQGKTFNLIKLRTMKDLSGVQSTITVKGDPRITFFGSLMRGWKLDELPQLANVLLGDMSLVGPRPCLLNQKKLINERKKRGVFKVRPGITGLSQIKGITMKTPTLLAKLDLKMIKQMSLFHYFYYIFKTVLLVIRKRS